MHSTTADPQPLSFASGLNKSHGSMRVRVLLACVHEVQFRAPKYEAVRTNRICEAAVREPPSFDISLATHKYRFDAHHPCHGIADVKQVREISAKGRHLRRGQIIALNPEGTRSPVQCIDRESNVVRMRDLVI